MDQDECHRCQRQVKESGSNTKVFGLRHRTPKTKADRDYAPNDVQQIVIRTNGPTSEKKDQSDHH